MIRVGCFSYLDFLWLAHKVCTLLLFLTHLVPIEKYPLLYEPLHRSIARSEIVSSFFSACGVFPVMRIGQKSVVTRRWHLVSAPSALHVSRRHQASRPLRSPPQLCAQNRAPSPSKVRHLQLINLCRELSACRLHPTASPERGNRPPDRCSKQHAPASRPIRLLALGGSTTQWRAAGGRGDSHACKMRKRITENSAGRVEEQ